MSATWSAARLRAETRGLLQDAAEQLRGRDVALIAAGLTFYANIAVVPLLLVALSLTALATSPEAVRDLGGRLGELLPSQLGAPEAVRTLVDTGVSMGLLEFVLALVPLSFYGEGLRRALLRFTTEKDTLTGWRGRLLAMPLVAAFPVLAYPLLMAAGVMADMQERGSDVGSFFVGYYSVLAVLTVPLGWGYGVIAGGRRLRLAALVSGVLFTAACLSGFLQGFVVFLALPLALGSPFGGLTEVGAVVAVSLWLWLLHLVVIGGWLLTQALDERLRDAAQPPGRPPVSGRP
ncbi:YhjD/YihY/BrkB family envelope integrity protein [Geodermatophilus sp. DSM 44513]|uniref:YhjD/YihY/BrkB family envelope integrity protein n=1 Tax=Geodermatophilus sp. DSM 44513 TaxID=1528104 RepID=UPI001274DC50|nr:YhjD/YihY/BrkB family envelope integrity protein [Geodermatophilus sp. DSM 44513]WNV75429.1 YhjD/YihY/BrkB family envelope integrity protein [Geodermatophilus sp. DSM 44513]